jgi:hypothetical protein
MHPPPGRFFVEELGLQPSVLQCRHSQVVRWQRPSPGWIKLNVDGSAQGNLSPLGGGGICRDNMGKFVFAFSSAFGIAFNINAELRAIHDVLELCVHHGFHQIMAESDSS